MAEYERSILAAEEKFFNECNSKDGELSYHDNIVNVIVGVVPSIAVLTKADALRIPVCQQLLETGGLTMAETMPRIAGLAALLLSKVRKIVESQLSGCKYPPKEYISLASKYSKLIMPYMALS